MDNKVILLKRWTAIMIIATLMLIVCCAIPGLRYLALDAAIGCGLICTIWMGMLTYAVAG